MKKFIKLLTTLCLAAVICIPAFTLTACNKPDPNDPNTILIGASVTPHAEILKDVVKAELKKQGYNLVVYEYTDYITPNTAVESGDLNANYFQHIKYMNEFNEENGTHLVSVAEVHYEAFGIYRGGKYSSGELADLPDGAKVLVPNDTTNEARALFLLQQAGLITLKENVNPMTATKTDIESNPKNLDITEVEAAQTAISLPDTAISIINGNYALGAGLSYDDALVLEEQSAAVAQYVNVIAVKEGHENEAKIVALAKAIKTAAVKQYILQKYDGGVVPVFEVEELLDEIDA
ncbi:MAG: MetQ/NlpA family ABC transporter substrate-binding protein [Bacteroides sp.]|nr:MetQ/NlpA family ABC transporter substrate-binding protein [Bacillota bacterium]MCM1393465.1 MetQ/NlpA family ABC transporter substrate-binding protein [[Eubacterium] siraeum]MCM1455301.1 MetQ/NlpA family ABC transporter substrate-binding protein [Bacteroides sp.]